MADAVVQGLVKPQDALAGLDLALDDPVDRASVKKFSLALRPHSGDVSGQAVVMERAAGCLPGAQGVDRLGADGKFQEVDEFGHGLPQDRVGLLQG